MLASNNANTPQGNVRGDHAQTHAWATGDADGAEGVCTVQQWPAEDVRAVQQCAVRCDGPFDTLC